MRMLLFLIAATLEASPTHIVDVLYQPNGNPPAVAAGTDITISQTAFVSGNNYYPAFSLSPHPVSDAGGNIDLWLEPNPLGQPYTILYRATNGVLTHEFWTVPIGSSVLKIKDVITSVGPSPPLGFVQLSQLAAGGASLNQVLSFNGTQWVPASLSTLGLEQTANKDQANGYAGLTAGTFLKAAEFPNFTGDCTSSAGTVSLNCSTIHLGGTAHGVVIGQAGSAVAVTGAGTTGYVLTSNGPNADPTFQPAPGGSSYFSGSLTPIVPGNWNTLGSGCTTTTVTGAGGGNALKIVGSTGAQNACGDYTSVAAGDFTHKFVLYAFLSGASDDSEVGVGFSDGGKVEFCAVTRFSTWLLHGIAESALTGGSVTLANGETGSLAMVGPGPIFFQLQRTGTTLKCSWSPDGQNYFVVFNDTAPYLTADRIVAIVDPRGVGVASTNILASYQ